MDRDRDKRLRDVLNNKTHDEELFNPLAKYSDNQLKGELKRRKKIKDSTELSGGHLW